MAESDGAVHHHHAAARAKKLEGLQRIGEYERQRLRYFTPQIRVNSTHWDAFKGTLAKSEAENDRVMSFFSTRMLIEEQYGAALAKLPYVSLGKGTGGWRKSSAAGKPATPSTTTSSSSSSLSSSGSAKAKLTVPIPASSAGAPTCEASTLPAMDAMMASSDALSEKYKIFVQDTRKELLNGKLKTLVTVFKATADEILAEGSHALDNVRIAEQHVVAAYAEYYKAAHALSTSSHPGGPEALSQPPPDVWLLDTNYRIAVELQKTIWQETQQQLQNLFTRMKTLEVNRRSQLHALILRFMQNQGAFWAQLPQAAAACSVSISGLSSTDPNQVDAELSEEIRNRAKALEAKEQHAAAARKVVATPSSSTAAAPGNTAPAAPSSAEPPAIPSPEPFTSHLKSPLDTALVCRVEMLERRLVTGVESLPLMKRWRPCLAVLTLDDYLHLFDLPSDVAPAGTVLTPRDAFKLLVPKPIDSKGRFKKGKDAERIVPSMSLALAFSKARYRPEEGPEAFEITESLQTSGFVAVFKARDVKRVTLKARTQDKMVDWIVSVNGEEGPSISSSSGAAPTTATASSPTPPLAPQEGEKKKEEEAVEAPVSTLPLKEKEEPARMVPETPQPPSPPPPPSDSVKEGEGEEPAITTAETTTGRCNDAKGK